MFANLQPRPHTFWWLLLLSILPGTPAEPSGADNPIQLRIARSADEASLSVFRAGETEPLVTQNAAADFRPFLHPIQSPDGHGSVTQFSPDHHRHQTGLYWGFTRLNGRDYFHHPEGDYWRRDTVRVLEQEGAIVRWETVYDLLDEAGNTVLTETQRWSMQATETEFVLDLAWRGRANVDVTIGEYAYGGLFLRMPWVPGIKGRAVNAARQRNQFAEGKRAMWLDVGMQLAGREDLAHVAIFDHPDNGGFPQPWRVDGQLGVGPVRARMGDWSIAAGDTEVISHRLLVYTGEMNDLELRRKWEAYIGQEGATYATASLWGIAQQEALEAEFLTGEEAARQMTLLDGYAVDAWASEPMVTQPMAFAWDDRGRLWVAENRDYESRSRGFSNSGDSRVVILEDTDRDGKADKRTVFLTDIAFPSALAIGFDGLFLGAPPHLLFVPDRDRDDKADMDDIEVRLTGWGIRDRHETINSLHWGPDGWLYGLEGFATPSKIRKPSAEEMRLYRHGDPFPKDLLEHDGVDINGGVWRYHPTKDRFEVVAHGFSNPWGIDYDAKGQLFISACVIPHLFHVIPGGVYQRQGGRHFNPYIYEDIGPIVDHRHRSAHGGARVYQSDAFPASQQGRLFMANIHEHAVLTDVLEPTGSGFVARHGDEFLLANNAQWIGFSVEIGPEGAVYVLDWHDADICGKEVLDKDTGRIFRITSTASAAKDWDGRYADLTTFSDDRLVALQESASDWHARRARVILQHRATQRALDESAQDALVALFADANGTDLRLKALWTLHVTGLVSESMLLGALDDEDEYVRAWAVQLLHEDPNAASLPRLEEMARRDTSPVVRKYLAATLQRLAPENRWSIARGLAARAEDAVDHNNPTMIWLGIEPLVATDPARALELASASNIPALTRNIARRIVDADSLEVLVAKLPEISEQWPDLLAGMLAGLEGRHDLETPENWPEIYDTLRGNQTAAALAREIAQHFGDAEAIREQLAILRGTDTDARRAALRSLATTQAPELVETLPALLEDDDLRREAIRAMAAFESQELGLLLLSRYAGLTPDEKADAIQTLASRPVYGWMLTDALEKDRVPRADIPAYIARQLRRVVGNGFVEIWGPIDQLPESQRDSYEAYKAMLTSDALQAADLAHGRVVFERTCGVCHRMYGQGGTVGPDLTGSNRTNLDYVLSNVISPGEVMQDDYRMVIVTTRGGRTYIGTVAAENERQVTLRVVGQDTVVLNHSDIQSLEVSEQSLMPEGLFGALSDTDIRDMVAYLRTPEQVPLQEE